MQIFFEKMFKRYGNLVKLSMPTMPDLLLMKNPDDVEALLKQTLDHPMRPPLETLKTVRKNNARNYFGEKGGILAEYVVLVYSD